MRHLLWAFSLAAVGCGGQPAGPDADSDGDGTDASGDATHDGGGDASADAGDADAARDASDDADSGDDGGGLLSVPPAESILDPAVYDCRAVSTPPARASTLPHGCFADPSCAGLVVVAHRGSSHFAPENTASAVRSAIALGVDMVEIDARLTADGEVVLLHDGDVDRTTTGSGPIDELTLEQVQGLGVRVADRLPATADFACERVPTLREILDLARDRVNVMLDLKEGPAESALVVEEAGMLAQVVMLGSRGELEAARAAVPDLLVMIRPESHDEVLPLWEAFSPAPTVVHIDGSLSGADTLELIHGLGAKALIDVWGADALAALTGDLGEYVRLLERGIEIQQSELAFFPLWAVGRGERP